ncbi:MAG: hypothetical protein IOC84_04460 [Rhodobacter sp.]|nr:hypothetical protein [Rhodobacter sp.]
MTTAAERAGKEPWTEARMIELAARALGKVDVLGVRGVTLCSANEIAAMAGVLALLGLPAIPPGAPVPDSFRETFKGVSRP